MAFVYALGKDGKGARLAFRSMTVSSTSASRSASSPSAPVAVPPPAERFWRAPARAFLAPRAGGVRGRAPAAAAAAAGAPAGGAPASVSSPSASLRGVATKRKSPTGSESLATLSVGHFA